MAVTPNVINKIKKVEYSTLEPSNKGVLWAEPIGEDQYTYRVYDNGQWNVVSSGGGEIPTNISYFYNDVGYITMEDLPSDLYEIPETGIPATDLSSDVQTSLGKADTALQTQVKSDWNATSGAAEILNKPTIPAAQVQSDWNATTGMGVILNKPTIPTVPTNVSAFNNDAGYLTSHQDITGKEDKMDIITVSATSLAPSVNKYYRFTADVGTLAVTLPTVTDTTKVASIVFYLTTGASPAVTFTSSHSVVYQDGFQLDASKTYEVNALFNGSAWVLMAAEINTGS